MSTLRPRPPTSSNNLLARLPPAEFARLQPRLRPVHVGVDQVLHEAHARMDYAYFPISGVTSALTVLADGSAIEVATVGNEGMTGLSAFLGVNSSANRVIVQVAGDFLRVESDVLSREGAGDGPLRQLLVRYLGAFQVQVSQSVACNGLHTVQQRCCRWLLMTHDRVRTDVIPLTHEYLAMMLGVRRATVTEVLHPLQEAGLLRNSRGRIRVLNREGMEAACCECYRAVKAEYERLLGPDPVGP